MPLSTAVFKGSGASLISKINKEMQIGCSRKVLCESGSRALGRAGSSSVRWEALGKGGCVIPGKAAAQSSAGLCGHKAASLPSRLFNSKQELSGGKEPTAAQPRHSLVSTADVAQAEQAGGIQKILAQAYFYSCRSPRKHSPTLSPRLTCQGCKRPTKFLTR